MLTRTMNPSSPITLSLTRHCDFPEDTVVLTTNSRGSTTSRASNWSCTSKASHTKPRINPFYYLLHAESDSEENNNDVYTSAEPSDNDSDAVETAVQEALNDLCNEVATTFLRTLIPPDISIIKPILLQRASSESRICSEILQQPKSVKRSFSDFIINNNKNDLKTILENLKRKIGPISAPTTLADNEHEFLKSRPKLLSTPSNATLMVADAVTIKPLLSPSKSVTFSFEHQIHPIDHPVDQTPKDRPPAPEPPEKKKKTIADHMKELLFPGKPRYESSTGHRKQKSLNLFRKRFQNSGSIVPESARSSVKSSVSSRKLADFAVQNRTDSPILRSKHGQIYKESLPQITDPLNVSAPLRKGSVILPAVTVNQEPAYLQSQRKNSLFPAGHKREKSLGTQYQSQYARRESTFVQFLEKKRKNPRKSATAVYPLAHPGTKRISVAALFEKFRSKRDTVPTLARPSLGHTLFDLQTRRFSNDQITRFLRPGREIRIRLVRYSRKHILPIKLVKKALEMLLHSQNNEHQRSRANYPGSDLSDQRSESVTSSDSKDSGVEEENERNNEKWSPSAPLKTPVRCKLRA